MIQRVIFYLIFPVRYIAHAAHDRWPGHVHHKHVKLMTGLCIVFSGSYMATHPLESVPHFLWDGVAYSLHGYGSLPIIHLLCKKYNLEMAEKPATAHTTKRKRRRKRKDSFDPSI